jgi:hypothetical protein
VDKDYLNQLYNKGVDFFKERSPSLPPQRRLNYFAGSWFFPWELTHTATHSSHRSNTILELRVAFDSELLLFLQH